MAEIDAQLESIGEAVEAAPDTKTRWAAEMNAYLAEPGIRPQAEADIQRAWTPGTHSDRNEVAQEAAPEPDAEAAIEI